MTGNPAKVGDRATIYWEDDTNATAGLVTGIVVEVDTADSCTVELPDGSRARMVVPADVAVRGVTREHWERTDPNRKAKQTLADQADTP